MNNYHNNHMYYYPPPGPVANPQGLPPPPTAGTALAPPPPALGPFAARALLVGSQLPPAPLQLLVHPLVPPPGQPLLTQPQPSPAALVGPQSTRRGPWLPLEDKKLLDLISVFGATNWVRISNSLLTRTPKQCRERYHQNLKPSLNRLPITAEEGELIEVLVAKYGKKWAEISRHLNGRSDNAIKNWWNGGANRRRRASQKKDDDDDHHPVKQEPSDLEPAAPTRLPVPSQFPQVPHLPQISFNTLMFGGTNSGDSAPQEVKPAATPAPRLALFDVGRDSAITLPPILASNKRRLLEDLAGRRHSLVLAHLYHGSSSSHTNLPSLAAGLALPPHHGLPLLFSTQALRNNLVSHFELLNPLTLALLRRSLYAPDLFPNPLKDVQLAAANLTSLSSARGLISGALAALASSGHKRNLSQNSGYQSPLMTPNARFLVLSSALGPPVKMELSDEEKKDDDRDDKEDKDKMSMRNLLL